MPKNTGKYPQYLLHIRGTFYNFTGLISMDTQHSRIEELAQASLSDLEGVSGTPLPPLSEKELLEAVKRAKEPYHAIVHKDISGALSERGAEERLERLKKYWDRRNKWEEEQGNRLLRIAKPSKHSKRMRLVNKKRRQEQRKRLKIQRWNYRLEKTPEGKARAFIKNWRALGHPVNIKARDLATMFRLLPVVDGMPVWRTKWNFRIRRIDINVPYQIGNLEFWHKGIYVPVPSRTRAV